MSNAQFCPICGDVISDGCVDDDGHTSYTPCVCETGIDSNFRIVDWDKAVAHFGEKAGRRVLTELREEIDAIPVDMDGQWQAYVDALDAAQTLIDARLAQIRTEAQDGA